MGSCFSAKKTARRETDGVGVELMEEYLLELKEATQENKQLVREKFWRETKFQQEEEKK
jgi:ribosomal protein S17E